MIGNYVLFLFLAVASFMNRLLEPTPIDLLSFILLSRHPPPHPVVSYMFWFVLCRVHFFRLHLFSNEFMLFAMFYQWFRQHVHTYAAAGNVRVRIIINVILLFVVFRCLPMSTHCMLVVVSLRLISFVPSPSTK